MRCTFMDMIGILLCTMIPTLSVAQEAAEWTRKADMGRPRSAPDALTVDDTIYVFGGGDGSGPIVYADVERYHPATDQWERLPDMPIPGGGQPHRIGDKIYLFGGWNNGVYGTVQVFDLRTETWTKLESPMPSASYLFRPFQIGSRIWLFGGAIRRGVPGKTTIDIFDPDGVETWTTKAGFPQHQGYYGAEMVSSDRLVFIGGGDQDAQGNPANFVDRVDIYDPDFDRWNQGAPMPTPRGGMATATDGRRVYVLGGAFPVTSAIEAYDADTDTWSHVGELPTPLLAPGFAQMGGKLYLFGGGGFGWQQATAQTLQWTIPAFIPTAVSAANKLSITWGDLKRR